MTLHLPWPLTNGEASKTDKISSTHPNLNQSIFLDSMSNGENMRKNLFLDFDFDQLQHRNPNLVVNQNQQIAIS